MRPRRRRPATRRRWWGDRRGAGAGPAPGPARGDRDGVAQLRQREALLRIGATREGTLHIFHEDSPDKFSVVETVTTEFGARNMALDPKTHKLFIDTADFAPAPAPTAEQPKPQPTPVSGTFRLLVYGR